MPNAHDITRSMGIKLHGRRDLHPGGQDLPPKHTWARKTINDVATAGEREGMPELVYDVLGVFLETEANQTQLFGDAISGLAKWAIRKRVSTEEFAFLRHAESFQALDMRLLRDVVRRHGISPRSPQIAFLVSDQMEAALWSLRQ